jgi:hypothetical protein
MRTVFPIIAALLAGCDAMSIDDLPARGSTISAPTQHAYLKASNTGAGDLFGAAVALSADGSTLAVGAYLEDSAATGVDGNQGDGGPLSRNSGAVYVFTRVDRSWRQQAYLKASNTGADDLFGVSLALSADGSTLAVGAYQEDGAATGVGGDESDDTAIGAGAVYVFVRSGAVWSQQAYVKASNTDEDDLFGYSVALSGDGSTLAAGAIFEDSAAAGVGGDEADDTSAGAGAVYVFARSGAVWSQQAYVKASNAAAGDLFGHSVALSADGSTLAAGAILEDSAAAGEGGDQADDSVPDAGAVYVFARGGATWSQQAYVKPSNTGAGDRFGHAVALSADGSLLAVSSPWEGSAATGVDGDQADDSAFGAGAVYVLARSDAKWSQQAYVKASNAGAGDAFGTSVALSADGSSLAVGAGDEDSAATGVGGDEADDSADRAGAVYVFASSGTTWDQRSYLKASNTDAGDALGAGVAMSRDGATLAVGASCEDSAAAGVDGDQADDAAPDAGAIYVFRQ